MTIRQSTLCLAAALGVALPLVSQAAEDAVRIGVLNDMSGVYSDSAGKGSLVAAQMAAEDFGGKVIGKRIDVIGADMQNKTDLGVAIAREWYDRVKVDMILDAPNSTLALAIAKIADSANRVFITSAASSDITGPGCTAHSLHWGIDTYALAHTAANALLDKGLDTWYFVTADYSFGHALERDATKVIEGRRGKVLGAVRAPLGTPDFSSFILQAQASGAKVVAFANAGGDAQASVKQAIEYRLPQSGQTLVTLDVQITHLHSLGPDTVKGMYLADSWYWDSNDGTRAFADRFAKRMGRPPSSVQAGMYSAATHYLQAVEAAGTDEALAVMRKMRELPIKDSVWQSGSIREDGRAVYDVQLQQAKDPAEVKKEWDMLNIVRVIPGDIAFRPIDQGGCPLTKKQ